MERSLHEYITADCVSLSPVLPSFLSFLNNIRLFRNHHVRDLPRLPKFNNYFEFMECLIIYLLSEKSSNILVHGYKDPSLDNRFNSRTTNSSSNFHVTYLRESNWQKVFVKIGAEKFLDLVLNNKGFLLLDNGNSVQLFGDPIPFRHLSAPPGVLNKNSVLHRSKTSASSRNSLVPQDVDALYLEVFSSCECQNKKLLKRMHRARRMLKLLISNERKCRYDLIYWKYLGAQKPNYHHLPDNSTPVSIVIQVVFSILQKLLPSEAWGGSLNRGILRRAIIQYIQLQKMDRAWLDDLTSGIKLKEIGWLGERQFTSQQDLQKRKLALNAFLYWLLDKLIPRILRTYWYVTECSNTIETNMLYFTHEIWNQISRKWLGHYIKSNLIKLELTEAETAAIQLNFGFMRLIPKLSDFRVICIPSRIHISSLLDPNSHSKEGQDYEFRRYNSDVLLPVGQILRSKLKLRNSHTGFFNRPMRSNADVAQCIVEFRKELADINDGVLPKLYVFKFDMMQCYDRLDQTKIMEEINKLFADEDDNSPYYFRQYCELDSSHEKWKKAWKIIQNNARDFSIAQHSLKGGARTSYFDKVKTLKLHKKDILEVCYKQVFETKVLMKNSKGNYEIFKRKRGVFQGLSLLGTFCDIVYSTMVNERFQFLESASPNLFIRLADDFLFVSSSFDDCKRVQTIVNSNDLHAYGAYVNMQKTTFIVPDKEKTVKFVGLEIFIPRLEIRKDYDRTDLITSKYRSFKSLLKYLKSCLQNRLHSFLINHSFGEIFPVRDNIAKLLSLILNTFLKGYRRTLQTDRFDQIKFIHFLNDLRDFTVCRYLLVNESPEKVEDVLTVINLEIIKCFRDREEFEFVLQTTI